MKTFKKLVLMPFIFCLLSCNEQKESVTKEEEVSVQVSHDYSEVDEYSLFWETMFDVESPNYYVYIYSVSCSHCNELKNYIIDRALSMKNIYFVKGTSKDQIGKDANSSKNAENPGDIWILGYPSLLKITNHKCEKNLAGINQIKGELK